MSTAFILFPNNLFRNTRPLKGCDAIFQIEEFLFFRQYKFHKQKLIFHRASMKAYEKFLKEKDLKVSYIDTTESVADVRTFIPHLKKKGFNAIKIYAPCDDWLEKRTRNACKKSAIDLELIDNPLFINSEEELSTYQDEKDTYFQTDFYIQQRKSRKILVDTDLNPLEGKWSFDAENRSKYPRQKKPPALMEIYTSAYHKEAAIYIEEHFRENYGEVNPKYFYPIDHKQAKTALEEFLKFRFAFFGTYEDAIVENEAHLHHSVFSALINSGLLLPMEVIDNAIDYATKNKIEFNNLEGFVRQILGWREFIRMIYIREGSRQRTRNFWNFKRRIPKSFYNGSTGIKPVDSTIQKLQRSAYNHHIERLMILGNFMLLCEFDPDEVYQWFMEMYIDAYDWVMVPNVYGMSQFADGGLMSTKPYISGSNYIFKMSDYKKGEEWADIWDALFWRFMHVHRSFFLHNPRLGMLVKTFDKWEAAKQKEILQRAETFLAHLDKNN